MGTALAFATSVLGVLPGLIQAGRDVTQLLGFSNSVLSKAQANQADPTPADWDQLNSIIDGLRKELHAP